MGPEPDSADEVDNHTIYDLSRDCANLFDEYLSVPRSFSQLINQSHRRFWSWVEFVGALAPQDVCLDTRLKFKPDIRGLIMLLLNVLRRNMHRALKTHSTNTLRVDEVKAETPAELTDGATYGIDGAVDRLHRLAVRIRRSSKTGLLERVRAFVKKIPPDDYENIVSKILEFKYPNMKEELVSRLTKTVIYRRHKLMYLRRHQDKLAHERDQDPQVHTDARELDPIPKEGLPEGGITSHLPTPSLRDGYTETAPSLVNTEIYKQHDTAKQIKTPTVAGSASSSWVGKITYPRPPVNADNLSHMICPFCFEEFLATDFETSIWWRSHVDKDLEHYVCISADCKDSLLYFDSFNCWLEHMNETHTEAWPQFVYAPTKWSCIFPHSNETYPFETVDELHSHLQMIHMEGFSPQELLTIAEKSEAVEARSRDICPVCNENITMHTTPIAPSVMKEFELIIDPKTNTPEKTKGPGVRFADYDDTEIGVKVTSQPTETQPIEPPQISTGGTRFRAKMARHVAGHLKSLSFLSLRGMEAEASDESIATDTAVQDLSKEDGRSDSEPGKILTLDTDDELSFQDVSSARIVTEREEDKENRESCLSFEPPHNGLEWGFMPWISRLSLLHDTNDPKLEEMRRHQNNKRQADTNDPNLEEIRKHQNNKRQADTNNPKLEKIRKHQNNKRQNMMILDALYQQLMVGLVECPVDSKKFLPRDALKRIISEDIVRRALCIEDGLYVRMKIKKPSKLPGIVAGQARAIFAALVLMEKTYAIYGLLDEGLTDEHLPLARSPEHPECNDLVSCDKSKTFRFEGWSAPSVDDFIDYRQWCFLSPILDTTGQLMTINRKCALPLVTCKYTGGSGAASIVFLSTIHSAHQLGFETKTVDLHVAVKQFHHKKDFRRENSILQQIKGLQNTHIIQHLVSIDKGEGAEGYIMFPWAAGGNLHDFWEASKHEPSQTLILWSLQQILGLTTALHMLHESFNCRHGDLKPENILCIHEGDEVVLKLTDFGIAKIHHVQTILRKAYTSTVALTPSYQGPEVEFEAEDGQPRSRKYDIWSLGCVFLEFTLWLLHGPKGIPDFIGARGNNTSLSSSPAPLYSVTDKAARVAKVHELATWTIGKLESNPLIEGDTALSSLLDLIKNEMLRPEVERRASAEDVCTRLKNILQRAENHPSYLLNNSLELVIHPLDFKEFHAS